MLEGIRSRLARAIAPPLATRRFEAAAAGGRRASGFGASYRINADVSAAAATVRSRARYLSTNNSHIANGVANWVGGLVGSGIVPTGDAEQVARFARWSAVADADGRTDFSGMQADVARALVVDGECFLRFRLGDDGLRLQILPAEMVDESRTLELSAGGFIANGIEFDASGQRVAYWVLPYRPTDMFAEYRQPIRVPASEIIHVFKPLGAGQVRGISWLAPVIVPANEFDAIIDALAVGIKVAALNCAFAIDQNGNSGGASPYDGSDSNGILDASLEPGVLRVLPAGYDVKFNAPQQASETASFLRFNLQMLAAGLGLPEHMLSGDLSNANYSSLRAGLLPFRTRVEQIQYGTLVPQFLGPVWRRVMFVESMSADIGDSAAVEWLPPRFLQVDPKKDVEADVAEIEAGLKSRTQAVAERGWNIANLDAEIAADRAREARLNLSFGTPSNGAPADDAA